jgi:hypothetical protein
MRLHMRVCRCGGSDRAGGGLVAGRTDGVCPSRMSGFGSAQVGTLTRL